MYLTAFAIIVDAFFSSHRLSSNFQFQLVIVLSQQNRDVNDITSRVCCQPPLKRSSFLRARSVIVCYIYYKIDIKLCAKFTFGQFTL